MVWIALISFLAGAVVAALRAIRLRSSEPDMPRIQVVLRSAAMVPVLLAILIAIASLYSVATMPNHGESGYPMAIYFLLLFGVPIALVGLVGGLVGATVMARAARS